MVEWRGVVYCPRFDFSMNTLQAIESSILEIRNTPVILDCDVATFYGVETMRINEAVKNNPDKFPAGYILELSKQEKKEVIENFDNPKVKFSPSNPKAFTEKGLYMLATILKSKQATETTLAIIEAFAKIRQYFLSALRDGGWTQHQGTCR